MSARGARARVAPPWGGGLLAVAVMATAMGIAPEPALATTTSGEPALPGAVTAASARRPGPSGSLVIVESTSALPLVHVVAALRSGSGWDPHKKEGLAYLAAATARRGAAGQSRARLDARLDALGATMDVVVDPDSTRFEGDVLARHLDAYLAILADVLLRPDFDPAEVTKTRRDLLARIDDDGTDDVALGQRLFGRNLYGDHPYGYPPEGTRPSLPRVRREDLRAFFRAHVVGGNVIFGGSGPIGADGFAAAIARSFAALPAGAAPGANPLAVREPQGAEGWRIQIVDKPDRQQAQIFFGQLGVRASDPSYVPLLLAASGFGAHAMTATLMDEIRTKRGLAYGAYMNLSERLGRGALAAWVQSSTAKAVPTLKVALKLYVDLMEKGIDAGRLAAAKAFLAGAIGVEMDDPARRIAARITSEVSGLPPGFVDELPERVRVTTLAQVNEAIRRHVRAHDLSITIVSTADALRPRLLEAGIKAGAIDVIPYDTF